MGLKYDSFTKTVYLKLTLRKYNISLLSKIFITDMLIITNNIITLSILFISNNVLINATFTKSNAETDIIFFTNKYFVSKK